MTQVLEYLRRSEDGAYACSRCEHKLGSADDYRTLVASYDESINAFEAESVHAPAEAFTMRHHLCPQCGVLFEVEMVAAAPGAS
jgi:acetone carboxylase gamma subunit